MTSKTLEPALDRVLGREQLAGDQPCHGLLGAMGVMGEDPTG